jgi:hypothetical protein
MDYSTLPNDPDHPAGTSPWSSSPQPNNNIPSFQSRTSTDAPPSPLATHSPYRPEPGSESAQEYPSDDNGRRRQYSRPETPGEGSAPEENGSSPDLSARLQSPQPGEPGFIDQPEYHQQHQYAPQQRSDGPQRYHTGARGGQRQNIPQYKLQAKITSLERTGRKDPILRFDVHVRFLRHMRDSELELTSDNRPTYPDFVLLNSVMFAACIRNLSNLLIT